MEIHGDCDVACWRAACRTWIYDNDPAAQATLEQKELGVGTSLVNFVNSLSGLIAAAVFGIAYDINTKADPQSVSNIAAGVNSVFLISALVSIVGLAIVLLVVRKQMNAQAKAA